MNVETLKSKVKAMLIKRGNGEIESQKVIDSGFDFAITKYTKVSQIANYLIVCY